MLNYDLEKRGKAPIYEYLYRCIREDILAGVIPAGGKLPSKREMARDHHIALITVENAYAQLLIEGYIYSREKSGYYVNAGEEPAESDAIRRLRKERISDYENCKGKKEDDQYTVQPAGEEKSSKISEIRKA
ncbi:MAG: GntR family transcriptional regulator, partial [Lachnospiraceae bacterium]|nr:GntR family transcriptional regulator [Lachnospiraceae bacterium]